MSSKHVMRAQRRKKQKAVDYFGGKCKICGYSKCIDAHSWVKLGRMFGVSDNAVRKWAKGYELLA